MDGFVVTPVTEWVAISFSSVPSSSRVRERSSSQIDTPAWASAAVFGFCGVLMVCGCLPFGGGRARGAVGAGPQRRPRVTSATCSPVNPYFSIRRAPSADSP